MNEEEVNKVEENANPEEAPKRKRGRPPKALNHSITLSDVIKGIKATGGRILEACKVVGISQCDFYEKYRHHPKVEEELKKARQTGFELVADVLYTKALEGDVRAIQLYLRHNPVARENGWVDNQTFTFKGDKPLSDEEKEALKKDLFG